jgi:nitrogen fixation protein FixH
MSNATQAVPLTGGRVLTLILAFFGVVFTVNGYLVVAALSTNSGVVAIEPYRKGLAYNSRITADERQTELGWQATVTVTRSGGATVALTNRDGRPVPHLLVHAMIGRPATELFDHQLAFTETAPGLYSAATTALDGGNWIASVEARLANSGADTTFRVRRRLWLAP